MAARSLIIPEWIYRLSPLQLLFLEVSESMGNHDNSQAAERVDQAVHGYCPDSFALSNRRAELYPSAEGRLVE